MGEGPAPRAENAEDFGFLSSVSPQAVAAPPALPGDGVVELGRCG